MNLMQVFMKFLRTDFVNLSTTKKICLSGILMALIIIFNKILAVNYIIPFARISFGSIALIIFTSIVLGPFYGLVIAGGADILGYFMFDMSSFAWFPQVTITYAVMGFVSFFIYKFVTLIKKEKTIMVIEYSVFAVSLLLITLYFIFNSQINIVTRVITLKTFERVLYPCLALLLFAIIIVINQLIHKKVKSEELPVNVYQISFIVFIIEIFVDLLLGGLMKAWAFGWELLIPIYAVQLVIMFFNIPYNTYIIFVIMKATKRFLK